MSTFIRLLGEHDLSFALIQTSHAFRSDESDARVFEASVVDFGKIPGTPFAYWIGPSALESFKRFPPVQMGTERKACFGLSTKDDFRFLRLSWECPHSKPRQHWVPVVKGGSFSRYYFDPYLAIDWEDDGRRLKAFAHHRTEQLFGVGAWSRWINNWETYFHPGIFWSRRSQKGLSFRLLPSGCIYTDKAPVVFSERSNLLALAALLNSRAFSSLVELQTSFGSYEVGAIQRTPLPNLSEEQSFRLSELVRRSWSLMRSLDASKETSNAFLLPAGLRHRICDFNSELLEVEIADIQQNIDRITSHIYQFNKVEKTEKVASVESSDGIEDLEEDEQDIEAPLGEQPALLSWCVGVVFGRFDWRLATGERKAPPEPDPFDPLPMRSPGMVPDGAAPFHTNPGVLVDDPGHPHDLPRLMEDVLANIDYISPEDVRRWLQREFFPNHLRHYSKSRRKAPIYWPLATASGSYMLWLYFPALTDQTLYTAVNDFVAPKLEETTRLVAALRASTDRSRGEENRLEQLEDLKTGLRELQDELLRVAPSWKPNHDDGVEITAAPLWRLFRHRSWQTALKETWERLEKGDYDWAHLAMSYWPNRVREKCRIDRSLAIAHDLEELYQPPAKTEGRGRRGRKYTRGAS